MVVVGIWERDATPSTVRPAGVKAIVLSDPRL
jgi:hypothetical protein